LVADITYLRLRRGFAYLAALLDAYSRRVVGWALARWIATALTRHALDQALATRPVTPGLMHHSDRGVQYAATAYVERLQEHGLQLSMAARGNPYENARAESFCKTLKSEEVYLKDYRDIDEAQQHLDRFIEEVYNTKRLHSALGYRPPAEFELLVSELPCELALVR
jgi:putative transposase